MQYNESGWLFQKEHGTIQNITKEVSYDDLHDLLIEADKDNAWAESVRQEVVYRDKVFNGEMKNPSHHIDPIIDYFRVINTGGTVTHYPFGRIITFASRRHLFRGENQRYSYSESTLSRKVRGKSREEAELLYVVANMRVVQFRKLIWNINVVPYWEAKVSEVNYKALAQHYGLDTYLLDLTNDFRIALFFATCKYEDGEYRPLTEDDIKASERSKYGVIFQTPDWVADYMQPRGAYKWYRNYEKIDKAELEKRDHPFVIDAGYMDGIAFQIGLQPFYRCHMQSGFVYPMKTEKPLQDNPRFEKIVFRQNPELSEQVFYMMHEGKDVYPDEGIAKGMDVIDKIKAGKVFSKDDLDCAYYLDDCDKEIFSAQESLRIALERYGYTIQNDEVDYHFTQDQLDHINSLYDNRDLLAPVGNMLHVLPEDKKFREERCREIYGKLI